MKKISKIFCMILAVCLMIPAICLLSACEPDNVVTVSTFEELQTALSGDKEIIKLNADIDATTEIKVSRKIILDLNGKKIYNSKDIWLDDENGVNIVAALISVKENGDLTIKGNGIIHGKAYDCFAAETVGGKLTVEDGTFIGNVHAIYVYKGELIINGGEYSIQQKSDIKADEYVINCYDEFYKDGTAKVTIKGGEYKIFNPANCYAEGPNTNFVAEGYKSVLKEGSTDIYQVVAE